MAYQRFEELPVWKDAIELAARILRLSQTGRFKGVGDLKSQLERAAISEWSEPGGPIVRVRRRVDVRPRQSPLDARRSGRVES